MCGVPVVRDIHGYPCIYILGYPLNIRLLPPKTTRLRGSYEDQRRLRTTGLMAPKKRGGGGASKAKKKAKPPARAHESDDDGDDMEEETDGPASTSKVSFGAQFMLFRVLMLAGVAVSFARSAGNVAKILSTAAQQGATWARCGTSTLIKLAHRACLGCELTPCANCIRLNISSWFGKVRCARAARAGAPRGAAT